MDGGKASPGLVLIQSKASTKGSIQVECMFVKFVDRDNKPTLFSGLEQRLIVLPANALERR
jgi:hypothetical protein